ncbi:uncharacterized protein LOC111718302 [Eurytemora carolleeae]|uniref:uncharacterized protein LOC111718302 n=1 Tax=Eurytemora carolleeae TaxID=1294199 RepID=UPI000C775589|nr:uncharacterized protein LOC111718302 [Eurytemora carolleeae]|eukprot:XP_023349626.1 uncharacterized protein LOC111718302 [Eurytemora affinis]
MMLILLLSCIWIGADGTLSLLGNSYIFTDQTYITDPQAGERNRGVYAKQYGPFGDDLVLALGNRDLHLIRGHSHEPHSSHRVKRYQSVNEYSAKPPKFGSSISINNKVSIRNEWYRKVQIPEKRSSKHSGFRERTQKQSRNAKSSYRRLKTMGSHRNRKFYLVNSFQRPSKTMR